MANFAFYVGLQFQLNSIMVSICRLQGDQQVMLEKVSSGELMIMTRDELLAEYVQGHVLAVDILPASAMNPSSRMWSRPISDLSEDVQSELRRRKFYLDWLEQAGYFTFSPSSIKPLIKEAAKKLDDMKSPSVTTVYRWHKKYVAANKDLRVLIPRIDLRGQRGRKLSAELCELIALAFEDAYRQSPVATIKTVMARLAIRIKHANQLRLPENQLVMPGKRTLYRVRDEQSQYEILARQSGKTVADRRLRVTKKTPQAAGILEVVEVDHTPLDLFIIDETSLLPLGRPILTLMLDSFSRMPLGYYLNFGGTSAAAVLGALKHAINPKKPVPSVISGLNVVHKWPCYGRMDALILDNGLEFHGIDLESIALDLGIRLQYCPTRVPQFKGKVERMLKTINYSFAHQIPGTSLARFTERGEYDPLKHALLTLAEFRQVFEKWLLDDYAQDFHRGIQDTPWAKWHEGLKRRTPELPSSTAELQRRIGRVAERALRHDGLWLHGIRYGCEELNPILQHYGQGTKLRVIYDPDDLGMIQVWPPKQDDPISVPAVHPEYANGLTLFQHQRLREILKESGRNAENHADLLTARMELASALDTLMQSRKQTKRRESARLHGITSENPNRRFSPRDVTVTKSIAPIKALNTPSEPPPLGKYSFFKSDDGKSGEATK